MIMKRLGKKYQISSEKRGYESEIKYLRYESCADKINIPVRIRERHLTQETDTAYLQVIGWAIQIVIPSVRDSIAILMEIDTFAFTDEYKRKISGSNQGLISVGTLEKYLKGFSEVIPVEVRHIGGDHELLRE